MGGSPWSSGNGGERATRRVLLFLIILIYLVTASAYALKTPKWNNPDEPAHFNYVRHIATTGTLPVLEAGDWDQGYLEQLKPLQFPDSMPIDGITYESHQPPLYYLLAAPVYRLLDGRQVDTIVLALRGLSIVFGAALVAISFALVRNSLPRFPVLALGTAAIVATVPMHVGMNAAVNNDTLAELVLSLALVLMVRGVRRGFSTNLAVALGLVLGLALLTKLMAYIALPLAAVALAIRAWLERANTQRPTLGVGARVTGSEGSTASVIPRQRDAFVAQAVKVYAPAVAVSLWWFVRNMMVYGVNDPFGLVRHDAVVVGQPRTSFTWEAAQHFVGTTFQSFWGQFGWMGIVLDRRIYVAAGLFTVTALVGFIAFLWRTKRGQLALDGAERSALVLLGLCIAFVAGALVFYNLTFVQAQGRYLFPAIAPIGLILAAGVAGLLPRSLAAFGLAVTYLGLLAMNYLVIVRFVAPYFGTL